LRGKHLISSLTELAIFKVTFLMRKSLLMPR